ncbi:NADH-ubiquinone oxidoreductase-F iron-sulfur binding region domain-containing protein [Microtetraspora sp. NBRC 16547]|uniref:NADH-ubiquinone oxidoreductase-F iron-sulfur binding region domain-containing protein n=1 Tax=Microtetraspora sp. NBRC 16547 TaxID=3030993 RepID=UPI0024A405B0|nr:NADH-ubiquinone oxidoreductase-F iron-sulfur binding region domain-containing protein [Microtetraspora sp. NBRC 16547]GLX02566.1 NADH dehydrogenase [Microtetraspora sp. NBRC 16547]
MSFPLPVRPLRDARLLAPEPDGAPRGPDPSGPEIIEIAEAAGVRGRGGAGFPLAKKLRSVASAAGSTRFVIANGEEGEPASVKDRFLLRERPELVLRGLALAARAVGADRSYAYVSDPAAARRLAGARGGDLVDVVRVTPGYVAGEETAVVRAVGGGPALPTAKPPRPWQAGLGGAPTLVSNAETLAQLALAVRLGPETYRRLGTPESGGTFLVTLSGAGQAPVLYEVPYGVPLRELVTTHRGTAAGVTGMLAGGFAGGLLPPSALDLPLTHAALAAAGSTLGCGAFVLLAGECPVGVAADVAAFFDRENARQCGPCVTGTAGVADVLAGLTVRSATWSDVARLERWGQALAGRGNCATPDAVTVLVGSLFLHHRDLVGAHVDAECERCAVSPVTADTKFRISLEEP